MRQYLDLLRDVRTHGTRKPTRAVLRSTGAKIDALSVFGRQIRFELSEGFPLVTTKKVAFGAIVHELIWFLQGSTNIAYLRQHGVTIWDEWADEKGELGPVYGKQWRSWPAQDGDTIEVHGNGPFRLPRVALSGQSLTWRAAPGYRPLTRALRGAKLAPDITK